MSGTPMPMRAIPQHGGPEMYLDPSKLTHKQRDDLRAELENQGYFIQYLYLEDPTRILVEAEIRQRLESEREAGK